VTNRLGSSCSGTWAIPAPRYPCLRGKRDYLRFGGISLKSADGMEKMKIRHGRRATVMASPSYPRPVSSPGQLRRCSPWPKTCERAGRSGPAMWFNRCPQDDRDHQHDAEGRLVLATAWRMRGKLGATHIVDIATLTGAARIALGPYRVGVMGNQQHSPIHFSLPPNARVRNGADATG